MTFRRGTGEFLMNARKRILSSQNRKRNEFYKTNVNDIQSTQKQDTNVNISVSDLILF